MSKKTKIILPIMAAAAVAAVYMSSSMADANGFNSKLTIKEVEYQGGIAGMSYADKRVLKNIKPHENGTVYQSDRYGISMTACDVSDESVRLKLSDRAFVGGEEVYEVVINKGDDIFISFANTTTGAILKVKYE